MEFNINEKWDVKFFFIFTEFKFVMQNDNSPKSKFHELDNDRSFMDYYLLDNPFPLGSE